MSITEHQPVLSKSIDARRLNGRGSIAAQVAITQVICINDHHIWFLGLEVGILGKSGADRVLCSKHPYSDDPVEQASFPLGES